MASPFNAALLSGLVFPGTGQIVSGHIKRGWLIVAVHIVLFFLIIKEILNSPLLEEIQRQGINTDMEQALQLSAELQSFSASPYLNILLLLFIVGWVLSIIDAYRLVRKK